MFYYFRRDRERERGGGQYCPQGDSKSKKTFFVKKTVSVLDDFTTLNSQGMGVIKLNSVLCFRFSFLSVCVGHCTGPIQWMNDCLCPTKFFQFCLFYLDVISIIVLLVWTGVDAQTVLQDGWPKQVNLSV